MQAHIANSGTRMKAGIGLMLLLLAAGFVALSWPTAAQENIPYRYRPPSLLDRMFGRSVEEPPPAIKKRPAKPRKPLLERLFGNNDEEPDVTEKKVSKAKSKTRRAAGEVVRLEEPEAVVKLDDARTVLVVGDFMAGGLSEGLVSAYAQNPNIKVIDRSNGSSGFVRNDFHDWPNEIGALIEAEKPAAVIVMLGANDRQQMKIGETREAPLTVTWTKEYQARTDALAAAIKQRGLPFVWVGLPAFKSQKVSADLVAFNDIYRKSTENAGGAFVDIWDGFVDENGAFVMNGPDMNGQPVRLRGSDGVSLSKGGKRKVAFYVEKPLNKLLGSETVPALGLTSPEIAGPMAPANIHVNRTQPIAIDDPELDGGQVLLGQTAAAKVETRTVGEKLVVEGIAPAPSPGRADDFGGAPAPVAAGPTPEEAAAAAGASAPTPETTNAIKSE